MRRFHICSAEFLHDDVARSRKRPLPGEGKGRKFSRMHMPTRETSWRALSTGDRAECLSNTGLIFVSRG